MAEITLAGNPVHTSGSLPELGTIAPDFSVTGADLGEITRADLAGQRVVLNIFPSLDTAVCATSVRTFNEKAAGLDNTVVLNVSADLPFAHSRFCGAEGIDKAKTGSTFRSDFAQQFGVEMTDGRLQGLLARSVVVLDATGIVIHTELVPEIRQEPDYDAALNALG